MRSFSGERILASIELVQNKDRKQSKVINDYKESIMEIVYKV